jgi:hypothetical protein
MKALLVIVGLVLAAGAGAAGGALFAPSPTVRNVEPLQPQSLVAPAVAISPEAQKRMDALAMEISDLQTQIASLRQEKSRAPATSAPEIAAAPTSATELAALNRDAILKVLDDVQAEKDRKREEERKQREVQQNLAHAERVATKVNLNPGQKQVLADFYATENQKREEMRTQYRDAFDNGTAAPLRDAFRESREWSTNELTRLFGTELGAQIVQADEGGRGPNGGVNGNGQAQRRGQRNPGGNGGAPVIDRVPVQANQGGG